VVIDQNKPNIAPISHGITGHKRPYAYFVA
jgi:hypothetical protein